MKILAFIGQMQKGGAERVMSLLVNEAVALGFQVSLLIGRNVVEYDLNKKVKIINLDADDVNPINRLKKIRHIFKDENPDVIVSFMSSPSIYACLCAIGTGIPVVISERNTPKYEVPGRIHGILRNIAYHFASGAIFQTEQARDYFSKRIRRNSNVIPNPVKDGVPEANRIDVKKVIVSIGRLAPQKNHKMLLDAFSMFLKSHSDYELHIYGRGELKNELLDYAAKLGIIENLAIFEPVDDVHEKIKEATMFVLPSNYEGISNALLECLAMGLPCISTDCPCGGSRLLIKNNENGLLVTVGNVEELCAAMIKLAEDKNLANQLGRNAMQLKDLYSTKKIMGRYLDYIISFAK